MVGNGARNDCSQSEWIDNTWGGFMSDVAASCETSLFPANPIVLGHPSGWVNSRLMRVAVSMGGPKSLVVPVRSRKNEPGLIDSQTGVKDEIWCCNLDPSQVRRKSRHTVQGR